ncbi:uncharacterized protein LOC126374478 [Pectinophora gossypiella]|uniref:uncharacterized protein LOC126374478 n=1 Tax=Pectinophora gossypiella TaxID=13191 RepID=UPI00214EE17D|nr:uncharacterized protein LOC126374478 [Pectinophora gossypiella]
MGSSHRLAAVAAASHARQYYNHTTNPDVSQTEAPQYSVNVLFVSATLCGVLVAVCAACWKRSPAGDKPEEECAGVYTVSGDARLNQASPDTRVDEIQDEMTGPPPAYDTVVVNDDAAVPKDCSLQEVITEPCPRCIPHRPDSGLPSYEAAVLLKDTKL